MDKRASFVFPDSIEIASLEESTLWFPELNQSKHDFHGLKPMTFHPVVDIVYFWLTVTEIIQFFLLNVTPETCSKTKLKTGQIQDREHFEILASIRSLIEAMYHLVFHWNWLADPIQFGNSNCISTMVNKRIQRMYKRKCNFSKQFFVILQDISWSIRPALNVMRNNWWSSGSK